MPVRLAARSLQGEAVHAADPQLVVGAPAGQGGHVHKEVLGLGGGAGQRLAQCSAHVTVGVLPLIAGGGGTGGGQSEELETAPTTGPTLTANLQEATRSFQERGSESQTTANYRNYRTPARPDTQLL